MKTVKKGDIGEAIVRKILEAKGLVIYEPGQDKAHVVDFYCQYKGKSLFAVEVKTYPRQYAYDRTGIDKADYDTYLELYEKQNIDVVLVFVDQFERVIYQQRISVLSKHAQRQAGKVYFDLKLMKLVRALTDNELRAIRQHSTTDEALYKHTKPYYPRGPGKIVKK